MAQRISPVRIMSVSKDGECHLTITLELNINLNANGEVGASLQGVAEKIAKVEKEEDPLFTVPDFVGGLKVNFGKTI